MLDHHAELKVVLEGNGDLSMEKIQLAMGEERLTCRVRVEAFDKGARADDVTDH